MGARFFDAKLFLLLHLNYLSLALCKITVLQTARYMYKLVRHS